MLHGSDELIVPNFGLTCLASNEYRDTSVAKERFVICLNRLLETVRVSWLTAPPTR